MIERLAVRKSERKNVSKTKYTSRCTKFDKEAMQFRVIQPDLFVLRTTRKRYMVTESTFGTQDKTHEGVMERIIWMIEDLVYGTSDQTLLILIDAIMNKIFHGTFSLLLKSVGTNI